MISYDLWQNELNRWSYMTISKLRTRLNRITKPDKLECFMKMARERHRQGLLGAAHARAQKLGYGFLCKRYPMGDDYQEHLPPEQQPTQQMRNPQTGASAKPKKTTSVFPATEIAMQHRAAQKAKEEKKKDKCVIGSKLTTRRIVEVD